MNIGLIPVDGHHFPNLALMKLAAYHKQQGDGVEWATIFNHYDIVYKSKVFSFTNDNDTVFADKVVKGGTGYWKGIGESAQEELFCDGTEPDYTIYKGCRWYNHYTAYGFLTRGCIRDCPWCIVPSKEGTIRPYRDIDTVLQGRKYAILMDNNILAHPFGIQQIERIVDLKCRIDFNQGLDARLITPDIAALLSRVKWIRYIRMACDTNSSIYHVEKAINHLAEAGVPPSKIFAYCLIRDVKESYERIKNMKRLGVTPFGQPFRELAGKPNITQAQRDLARWTNHKAIFNSVDFPEYEPRIGFKCRRYFHEEYDGYSQLDYYDLDYSDLD